MEITQSEQENENKIFKNEDSTKDCWDNIKCTDLHFIGIWEGTERKKGAESTFEEIMAENFFNQGKKTL